MGVGNPARTKSGAEGYWADYVQRHVPFHNNSGLRSCDWEKAALRKRLVEAWQRQKAAAAAERAALEARVAELLRRLEACGGAEADKYLAELLLKISRLEQLVAELRKGDRVEQLEARVAELVGVIEVLAQEKEALQQRAAEGGGCVTELAAKTRELAESRQRVATLLEAGKMLEQQIAALADKVKEQAGLQSALDECRAALAAQKLPGGETVRLEAARSELEGLLRLREGEAVELRARVAQLEAGLAELERVRADLRQCTERGDAAGVGKCVAAAAELERRLAEAVAANEGLSGEAERWAGLYEQLMVQKDAVTGELVDAQRRLEAQVRERVLCETRARALELDAQVRGDAQAAAERDRLLLRVRALEDAALAQALECERLRREAGAAEADAEAVRVRLAALKEAVRGRPDLELSDDEFLEKLLAQAWDHQGGHADERKWLAKIFFMHVAVNDLTCGVRVRGMESIAERIWLPDWRFRGVLPAYSSHFQVLRSTERMQPYTEAEFAYKYADPKRGYSDTTVTGTLTGSNNIFETVAGARYDKWRWTRQPKLAAGTTFRELVAAYRVAAFDELAPEIAGHDERRRAPEMMFSVEVEPYRNGGGAVTYIGRSYALLMLRQWAAVGEAAAFGLCPLIYFGALRRSLYSYQDAVFLGLAAVAASSSCVRLVKGSLNDVKEVDLAGKTSDLFDSGLSKVVGGKAIKIFGGESCAETNTEKRAQGLRAAPDNMSLSSLEVWDVLYAHMMLNVFDVRPEFKHMDERTEYRRIAAAVEGREERVADYYFWRGTAPFCDGGDGECEQIEGGLFTTVDLHKSSADGLFGSSCWSGRKAKCLLDRRQLFRNNSALAEYGVDARQVNLQFKWFGSAPSCDPDVCDLLQQRYFPVAYDKRGDGSVCVSGTKILGVRPVGERFGAWKFPNYEALFAECVKYSNAVSEAKWSILKNLVEMAKTALETVLAPGSGAVNSK